MAIPDEGRVRFCPACGRLGGFYPPIEGEEDSIYVTDAQMDRDAEHLLGLPILAYEDDHRCVDCFPVSDSA